MKLIADQMMRRTEIDNLENLNGDKIGLQLSIYHPEQILCKGKRPAQSNIQSSNTLK